MKSAAPGGTKSIKGNCIDLFLAMLIQSVCFLCMTFATRSLTLTLLLSVHWNKDSDKEYLVQLNNYDKSAGCWGRLPMFLFLSMSLVVKLRRYIALSFSAG